MEMRELRSDRGRNRDMKNGREFSHSRIVERKDMFRQIRNERVWEKTLEVIITYLFVIRRVSSNTRACKNGGAR